MTHEAAIKIAPLLTLERFDDPKWRSDRTMYESGSLRFLPGMESVPLIVNHDDEWVIGTVHELFKMDWIDGPWIAARCTVDTPPVWMKRNTRASFGFKLLHRREVNIRGTKADVVATALVTEVSILPDFVEPAEPLAEVLTLHPTEHKSSPPAAVTGLRSRRRRWACHVGPDPSPARRGSPGSLTVIYRAIGTSSVPRARWQ